MAQVKILRQSVNLVLGAKCEGKHPFVVSHAAEGMSRPSACHPACPFYSIKNFKKVFLRVHVRVRLPVCCSIVKDLLQN